MKKFLMIILGGVIMFAMNLTSPDFKEKISIEQVYPACGGENISPELFWSDFPKDAKSFAITMFDPDAPTDHGWWHWIVVNIPVNVTHFPKNAGSPMSQYFDLGFQTVNDYGEIGYGGPCPPPGPAHRYIITVYALDIPGFKVSREVSPQLLAEAIKEHTIASAEIMGYYKRGWE
ncbi:YbhB/YbcL family Raf kinase inhibitor-like protein [Caminibacter sp.]